MPKKATAMPQSNKSKLAKTLLKLVLVGLLGIGSVYLSPRRTSKDTNTTSANGALTSLENLKQAFANQRSNFQVTQVGQVEKILRDDDHAPRHQRFVIRLKSGQKLLIAHNIDLAARVENLKEGTTIAFYGEYEWNSKGGVVHWTHHDPKGRHPGGWLLYGNRKYD